MRFITKNQANIDHLQARTIYRMIESAGVFNSENMTMGIARFDQTLGAMTPHVHGEEGMYVIDCAKAFVRFGGTPETLGQRNEITPGMIMWAPEGEYHVFEFEDGGFMDIVFFFAVGKFNRPK